MQNGGSQQKGAGSQLWGAGSVIRGSGSQTSGAGSEIQWDPPNLTLSLSLAQSRSSQLNSTQLNRELRTQVSDTSKSAS